MKILALNQKMAKFGEIILSLAKFAIIGIVLLFISIFCFLYQIIVMPLALLYSFGLFLSHD